MIKTKNPIRYITHRWNAAGGYREVLTISIPLMLSTGAWSVQHFVDRMFLTWYSPEAIAAAMPAGILNFTVMSLFIGTATYVSTFVAQYFGSGQIDKIGPSLWQGMYVSVIAGIVHLALIPLAGHIFSFFGHEELVQKNEIIYFQILCLGAMPLVASSALGGFFSGRGETWPIMWVNVSATVINLVMDYALIFGRWGFPSLGMEGAGIATVISACFSFISYLFLIMRPSYNRLYNTLKGWKMDASLFMRLMKFGLPSGIQFFLDITGITIFILLIGRLGTINLAASNIAFNINTLAFMPMIGTGIAISVMVGQYLGKGQPDLAETSTYSGFHLTTVYMGIIALLYVTVPNIFLEPFAAQADAARFDTIRDIAVILLRFVAFYSLFDTMNIIFASAIKGAGDTRFVMYMITIISSLIMVIPSYITIIVLDMGLYVGWSFATFYIITLGFIFLFRFRGGKWKSMLVIEEIPKTIPPSFPEIPTPD
jgi:MATE family multidrug resistance protein